MRVQLETRQTQLLETIEQIDRYLDAADASGIAEIGELRVAYHQMLVDHWRFKEEVYRRLRACGIVHVDRQVARSRSAMLAVQVAHRFHLADWNAEAITRDWDAYLAAARALLGRVCAGIEADRAHLYPLLDQVVGTVEPIGAIEEPSTAVFARTISHFTAPAAAA